MDPRPSLPVGGVASDKERSKPAVTLTRFPGGTWDFRVTPELTVWGRSNLGCPALLYIFVLAPLIAIKDVKFALALAGASAVALLFTRDDSRYVRWELSPGRAVRFIRYPILRLERTSRYAVLGVTLDSAGLEVNGKRLVRLALVTEKDGLVRLHPYTDRGRELYTAGRAVAEALEVEFHATPAAEEILGSGP